MTYAVCPKRLGVRVRSAPTRRLAFTLVELLTVLFIISLLIGILIPSLSSARNAAKKASTKAVFASLKTGLEAFKNDNEREFRATNGYPPSFAHPPIRDSHSRDTFNPIAGQFPFMPDKSNPVLFGAHWLPAMLVGMDTLGYAPRRTVPRDLRASPERWYESKNGKPLVERAPLYLDPSGLRMVPTQDLPGTPNLDLFPSWSTNQVAESGVLTMSEMPVIVDAFEQPILYYAANAFGTTRHMVHDERNATNNYGDEGPPYYFHQDNEAFTGTEGKDGWIFGDKPHMIADSGELATAANIDTYSIGGLPTAGQTFAKFIHDRKAHLIQIQSGAVGTLDNAPLKPANPNSYLLISAGVDGRYGTADDVTNFPINEPG